jgi:hypothetical protein
MADGGVEMALLLKVVASGFELSRLDELGVSGGVSGVRGVVGESGASLRAARDDGGRSRVASDGRHGRVIKKTSTKSRGRAKEERTEQRWAQLL